MGQQPIAFIRTGTTGARAERPPARLVVRVEYVRVDVIVAAAAAATSTTHVRVGWHQVQMMMVMMTVRAVHQRLRRFLQTQTNHRVIMGVHPRRDLLLEN